jgi:hypothetical protein
MPPLCPFGLYKARQNAGFVELFSIDVEIVE